MAQGTLPEFISALRAGLRPVALRNGLRASRAHPSFPFSCISGFTDSLQPTGFSRGLLSFPVFRKYRRFSALPIPPSGPY